MKREVLVSVVVVTYNSAQYIVETLESIKAQTYKNIEIIISDDASSDDTIAITSEWLEYNKLNFKKYQIVESSINTGVTCNCNRGIKIASGDYIKIIAGDDLLLSNCVEDLLKYSIKNNLKIAFGKVIPFTDNSDKEYELKLMRYEKLMYELFDLDEKTQYRSLLTGFHVYITGLFLSRELIVQLGGFDEQYKMMEDYPFIIKVSSMGYKLNMLDKYVVKYRVRSIETQRAKFFFSKRKKVHASDLSIFQKKELLPRLKKEKMYMEVYDLYISRLAKNVDDMNDSILFAYLSKIIGYLSINKFKNKVKMMKILKKSNFNL